MAATRSLPSSYSNHGFSHAFNSPKPKPSFASLPLLPKSTNGLKEDDGRRIQVRSEIKSFENSQNWTVEADRFRFVQNSSPHSPSTVSIATSSSAMDSAVRATKKVCLFYCAETKALAERVAAQSDAIELRTITWRKFDDGFPNIFIPNAHGIRGQHVAFLASFSSPGVIFEQLSVIYALPKLFISSFTLVLPFFPTGTSERMEDEGDVATAFTLARALSNIPISRGGPTSLVTFDIHALQERFYFGDNILPCFDSGIPLLMSRLQELPDSHNISIAFPDDGAWKRFHKQLQHFPTIVCAKVREGDQRIVRIKEGDPRGRHVVIVDDLVQSGGTLIECQETCMISGAESANPYEVYVKYDIVSNSDHLLIPLKACFVKYTAWIYYVASFLFFFKTMDEFSMWKFSDFLVLFGKKVLASNGATKISAYVTHGIFPNRSWERFEHDNEGHPENGLTYFWITDSCPLTVQQVKYKAPFEVLSLAGSIAATLQI